ncbi:MAG: biopolymer transporter ExbD [Saprospiraceae bacterium]|nr:biopolymer transporter ExbD [Saprospiraceae bacterium]
MPKKKIARKSTAIDMTAMCDVSFLLLTFFMLATKFKPPDPVEVVTPASISDTKVAETNIITITIDKNGRVFFDMDGIPTKHALIDSIDRSMRLGLTPAEKQNFALSSGVGVPFNQLKSFLNLQPADQKSFKSPGIPVDTTLTDSNELFKWVAYARLVNPEARLSVKGDGGVKYPVVRAVFSTLANKKIQGHKFYAVTSLKANPNQKEGEEEEK